ncbi:DUF4595 domain-containing protein [Prevotella sp.]|uniref:DUF4595 domain-containing protein n=1 Tax=Prevotella sp. TaxID=59823 RepID=UPI003F802EDD
MKMNFSDFFVRMNKTAFVFATAAVCAFGAVSCGDDGDDDDAGGGGSAAGNTESGVIQTPTGEKKRVAKAGQYSYSYNSDGTLASFFDGEFTYNATYNPFTVTFYYKDSDIEETGSFVISLNGKGYISGIKESDKSIDSEGKGEGSGNISFSYDGNGHLTHYVAKGSGYRTEEGKKYNYTSKSESTYTWEGGKLLKITYNFSNGYEKESETYEYTYGSNAMQNVTCQYVPAFIDEGLIGALFYIGYYGKGPSVLPTSCKVTYKYNEGDKDYEESDTENYTCTYTLNSDGTVNTFTGIENGTMVYGNSASVGSKIAAKPAIMKKPARGLYKGFFRRIRNK